MIIFSRKIVRSHANNSRWNCAVRMHKLKFHLKFWEWARANTRVWQKFRLASIHRDDNEISRKYLLTSISKRLDHFMAKLESTNLNNSQRRDSSTRKTEEWKKERVLKLAYRMFQLVEILEIIQKECLSWRRQISFVNSLQFRIF